MTPVAPAMKTRIGREPSSRRPLRCDLRGALASCRDGRRCGARVPSEAPGLGSEAPPELPLAGDGRSLPGARRRGDASALARHHGREGLSGAVPTMARRREPRARPRVVDRGGHQTTRVGQAGGNAQGDGSGRRQPRRSPRDPRRAPRVAGGWALCGGGDPRRCVRQASARSSMGSARACIGATSGSRTPCRPRTTQAYGSSWTGPRPREGSATGTGRCSIWPRRSACRGFLAASRVRWPPVVPGHRPGLILSEVGARIRLITQV